MIRTLLVSAVCILGMASGAGCDDRSRARDPEPVAPVAASPPAPEEKKSVSAPAEQKAEVHDVPSSTTTTPPVEFAPDPLVRNKDGSVAIPSARPWPRKLNADPATGYVMTPAGKVKHPPRIIAWYPIGNSDTSKTDRRIGWNIKKDGWAGFINKSVEPAIKLGFDAVQLHNPAGTREKEEMQPDQFLDAMDDGVDWISRGFVDAWKPVTRRVEVIAYLGMLQKNERFEGLLKKGDRAGFLQALTDSYKLPLDAKMNIAFDALNGVKPDGWELQVYRLFTAMGVKTYIEPIPSTADQGLYDANFEVMNRTVERALRNGEPWVPALDQLSGERIILLAEPPLGKEWKDIKIWLPGFLKHWTRQGWSVAINPDVCIENNLRPWDLAGGKPSSK